MFILLCVSACINIMSGVHMPVQDWLASSGRKVSLAGRPMEWLTPLGLPVVQPYHKVSTKSVSVVPKYIHLVWIGVSNIVCVCVCVCWRGGAKWELHVVLYSFFSKSNH